MKTSQDSQTQVPSVITDGVWEWAELLSTVQIQFTTKLTFLFMQLSFRWHKYHHLSRRKDEKSVTEIKIRSCANSFTALIDGLFAHLHSMFLKPPHVQLLGYYPDMLRCILSDTTTGERQSWKTSFSTHQDLCATCKWYTLFPVACLSIYCINTL